MSQSISPRLARYYFGNRRAYKRLLFKFSLFGLLLGLGGIAVSVVFGSIILSVLFKPEYAQYNWVFVQIMTAGAVLVMFSIMNVGLTAARKFAIQVPLYATSAAGCALTAFFLVPRFGISGAAWSLLVCNTIGFLGCFVSVCWAASQEESSPDEPTAATEPLATNSV
jgi:O-antigen/teichoic acid export membrane protein